MPTGTLAPPFAPPRFEPQRDKAGEIIYPESDGLPMAWNTIHYRLLTLIKDGFESYFAEDAAVFVAGDLLWYPVKGHPEIAAAPDVFIAIGRPKGDRRSYRQWEEGDIAPQVVFEVLSDCNTAREMMRKMEFYSQYGVDEYVIFDPDEPSLQIWKRENGGLKTVPDPQGWESPLLKVTYWTTPDGDLQIVMPDGRRMLSYSEQKKRADEAESRASEAEARAARLAEKLKAAGIDPEA